MVKPFIRRFAGYPRTGGAAQDVHVAPGYTDHGSRPIAAQSRSELSLATRSGPRTMEATRGNGYAPVRGMPAMMMTMINGYNRTRNIEHF